MLTLTISSYKHICLLSSFPDSTLSQWLLNYIQEKKKQTQNDIKESTINLFMQL